MRYKEMKNNELITYVDRLIEKLEGLTSKEWAQNINAWDWNPGVGLMGVVRAAEVTQKKEYIEFLEKWFERNVENRWFGSVNNVAPANVPLYLAKQNTDSIYKEISDEYFDWCVNKSVRTTNNGFGHVWEDKISGKIGLPDYKNQLWVDSIYMTCIFLVKYGLHYKNDEAIKLALEQSKIHTQCLFCEEADLFSMHIIALIKKISDIFGAEETVGLFPGADNFSNHA